MRYNTKIEQVGRQPMVKFTVTGSYLTHIAREHMRDSWKKALDFLTRSVVGFPTDFAIKICQGVAELFGENDEIYYEETVTESEELSEYLDWYRSKWAGLYQHRGDYYLPYAYVSQLGPSDRDYRATVAARAPARYDTASTELRRYLNYCDDAATDLIRFLRFTPDRYEENKTLPEGCHTVLFTRVDAPYWLYRDATQDALSSVVKFLASGNYLEERGHFKSTTIEKYWVDPFREEVTEPTPEEIQSGIQESLKQGYAALDPAVKSRHGWVSPDGSFYGCRYEGHLELASNLTPQYEAWNTSLLVRTGMEDAEKFLEDRNWIKIGECLGKPLFVMSPDPLKRPTPAQIKTLKRWCDTHDVTYPDLVTDYE